MKHKKFQILFSSFGLIAISLFCAPSSYGVILFDFENNVSPFDGTSGVGTMTTEVDDVDPALSATLTTVDVFAPEFDGDAMLTGTILFASAGGGGGTNVAASDSLGINNPSISNGAFETAFGPSGETTNINPGEGWVFEFDTDVVFDFIDFASIGANDEASISIAGGPTVLFGDGTANDIFDDPFSGFVIAAGTDITLSLPAGGSSGTLNQPGDLIRVTSFGVNAVPEPGSLSMFALFISSYCFSRKRRSVV